MTESRKVCAVVGAGPGLGMAVARRFGREGYRVAILARNGDILEENAKALRAQNVEALPVQVDAARPDSMASAFEKVRAGLGDPGVLVYNAAVMRQGLPSRLDPVDVIDDFRVNVVGALVAAQSVLPAMRQNRHGTILLTGGGLALEPFAPVASLAIGKAGIRSLALSLAREVASDGVHVATVTVCGLIKPGTPFAPERIAEHYWTLHAQPEGEWQTEVMYRG